MITLSETPVGIGIPYPPIIREGRSSNHGYVDLKRFPSLISTIPELQNDPALLQFVLSVNDSESAFRTLGCNCGVGKGYVHLAFEVLHWNTSKGCYRRLVADYLDWQKADEHRSELVNAEFRICPASYWEHQFDGWAMSVHFEAIAERQEKSIGPGLRSLGEFLQQTSKQLLPQLKSCAKTIS